MPAKAEEAQSLCGDSPEPSPRMVRAVTGRVRKMLVTLVVCVGLCVWQVMFLNQFFQRKKLL